MKEFSLIFILIGVIIYLTFINYTDRRSFQKIIDDLLNRIYSKNFPEYVDGRSRLQRKPDEPLSTKERLKGLELAEKLDGDRLEVS